MVAEAVVVNTQPQAQTIPTTVDELLAGDGAMVKQLTNECCRCFVCQPNIHWTLHPYWGEAVNFDDIPGATMWIQEEAAYCDRVWSFWAPGCRPTTYCTVEAAPPAGSGEVLAADGIEQDESTSGLTHKKSRSCGVTSIVGATHNGDIIRCPMCCCLPYMETYGKDGELYGTSRYLCDECLFVPKFGVYDASGTEIYRVRPDTCLGGICVRPRCGGAKGKCFRVPFLIRDPATLEQIEDATITDLWSGFKNECCTKKNIYAVKWPSKATKEMRGTLIGTTLLVDVALFEQEGK